jgi:hypothetical protein
VPVIMTGPLRRPLEFAECLPNTWSPSPTNVSDWTAFNITFTLPSTYVSGDSLTLFLYSGETDGGAPAVNAYADIQMMTGAVTFTIDSSSTGCTIGSGVVAFTAAGTCVIDANQAGNGSYLAAPQVQQTFTVSLATQTINFNSPSGPASPIVGGLTYPAIPPNPPIATGGPSGNPVTITSTTPSVCTVSVGLPNPNTVTFVGAGTCTLDANQAGNSGYLAAPQVQQSFSVTNAIYKSISCPVGSTFCMAVTNTGKEVIWSANPKNVPSYLTK